MRNGGVLLLLVALAAGGCATGPSRHVPSVGSLIHGGVPQDGVGIALAGGGTKAASYGMGVLAAVADSAGGFSRVRAISTVSGGGYAAFFLYSKWLLQARDPEGQALTAREFFADCLPHVYDAVLPPDAAGGPARCAAEPTDNGRFRFQQYLRCRQDVLEQDCRQQLTRLDLEEYAGTAANTLNLLAGTGVALVPNLVARTLFDWPVNLSPSRHAYQEGIGTAYGLYPLNASALAESPSLMGACRRGSFLNCDPSSGFPRMNPAGLGFADLRRLTEARGGAVPTWIINATASRSRSLFGWARRGVRDFGQYTLQLSPHGARSGFHGEIQGYEQEFDLLTAVTAAAAFFDSNETALAQPWRMGAAMGQHLLALDWGVDIKNPNLGVSWRWLHTLLPAPLYYLDGALRRLAGYEANQRSAYIRVIDGGNNDNLGAYSLLEAGLRHLVISDHAWDARGTMTDMCRLHNEIQLRSPAGARRKLLIPGLQGFAQHCQAALADSEGGEAAEESSRGGAAKPMTSAGGYPIHAWTHPVLLGCVRPDQDASEVCDGTEAVRVYLLKPALDLAQFTQDHLERPQAGGPPRYRVKPAACSAQDPGPCEVAAYIADWFNRTGSDESLDRFPQHGTASMTWVSTGKLFGAYRELARWQMRQALRWVESPPAEFAREVARQLDKQIPWTPAKSGDR